MQERPTMLATLSLLDSMQQRGYIIDQGPDVVKYLDSRGANAATFCDRDLLLRPDARHVEVLEEYLHNVQVRVGMDRKLTPNQLEWHVKDFMIRHRKLLRIADVDVQWLEGWLEQYRSADGRY